MAEKRTDAHSCATTFSPHHPLNPCALAKTAHLGNRFSRARGDNELASQKRENVPLNRAGFEPTTFRAQSRDQV